VRIPAEILIRRPSAALIAGEVVRVRIFTARVGVGVRP
jgi:hypothetical protein